MGWQTSPFGNGVLVGSGGNVTRNVDNFYGSRAILEGAEGVYLTDGIINQYSWEFTGQDILDGKTQLIPIILPAGALVVGAIVKVKTAFAETGTSPTILLGTSGSEVTNGVVITASQANAVGTYNIFSTATGTWAAVLAADTTSSIALGGTSPVVTGVGRLEIVLDVKRVP